METKAEIIKIKDAIDTTKRGASIEYSHVNSPSYLLSVSSGEISPYEFTKEEMALSNGQKDDIKRKKKEYKKLIKSLQKGMLNRINDIKQQNITPYG